jgi:hypothetical protein
MGMEWQVMVPMVELSSAITCLPLNSIGDYGNWIGQLSSIHFILDNASLLKGGQYVDALCRPLLDEKHPINSKIVQEKVKALRRADEQWALRLWDVSLRLLSESPANGVVANAP